MTDVQRLFLFDNDNNNINKILNSLQPTECFRFGQTGAGNSYLNHVFNLANIEHNISHNDVVIMFWTNFNRWDWFIDFKWSNEGDTIKGGKYNSLLHTDLNKIEHCMSRDIAHMYGVMKYLDYVGAKHYHQKLDFTMFVKHKFEQKPYNHKQRIMSDYIRTKLTKIERLSYDN